MDEWSVTHVTDADAVEHDQAGIWVRFEDRADPFPQLGVHLRILKPGQANARYHVEDRQEDFLVLEGECVAILDGAERQLRGGDFVHCPPGVPHVFVGAGDAPCAILMMGTRAGDATLHFPADETAARYGASVTRSTDSPQEAYADWARSPMRPTHVSWPPL